MTKEKPKPKRPEPIKPDASDRPSKKVRAYRSLHKAGAIKASKRGDHDDYDAEYGNLFAPDFKWKVTHKGKGAATKMAAKKTRTAARSAKSAKFVTKKYAKKHPSTTVVERVKVGKKSKKKK